MKNDVAKQLATDIIVKAFGDAFIGISDKKIFVEVRAPDGDTQQVSIALACSKTPLSKAEQPAAAPAQEPSPQAFAQESENIKKLMESLNIL